MQDDHNEREISDEGEGLGIFGILFYTDFCYADMYQ